MTPVPEKASAVNVSHITDEWENCPPATSLTKQKKPMTGPLENSLKIIHELKIPLTDIKNVNHLN